jgi:hypothetical protein
MVSVTVRAGPPDLDAETNRRQYIAGIKNNMGESYRIDPVEGLNAAALWNPDMKQLTVFKGATLVILTIAETAGRDPIEAAKALAQAALTRI